MIIDGCRVSSNCLFRISAGGKGALKLISTPAIIRAITVIENNIQI